MGATITAEAIARRYRLASPVVPRRPRMAQETRPLLVRMSPELHEAVEETARKQDRTKAQVVREALRAYTRKAGVKLD
jgi:hypothetical protein